MGPRGGNPPCNLKGNPEKIGIHTQTVTHRRRVFVSRFPIAYSRCMNIALIALIGGLVVLSRVNSKAEAVKGLEFVFTKFAIEKQPFWKYLKDGLPIRVEAAAINESNETLRFKAFNGSFRLSNGYWNNFNFVPQNGIGIPAGGGGLVKFSIQVPTEAVFAAIEELRAGTLNKEVEIKGTVFTNTVKIPINQIIELNV